MRIDTEITGINCFHHKEICLAAQVSYFEIYMDKIRDLLDGKQNFYWPQ